MLAVMAGVIPRFTSASEADCERHAGHNRRTTVRSDLLTFFSPNGPWFSPSQDSVSASSETAVRGSSSDKAVQSANAPIAYGAVWTSAASNE